MNKFSVLMSLYVKENPLYLKQALQSIFKQTCSPSEVVMMLDGVITKELEEELNNFKKQYPNLLKIFPLLENVGLGIALNEGLKHCNYDIVARMDTDDIAKPNRFEKQLAILENNPKIDIVGAWINEFENEILNVKSIRKLPEFHDDIYQYARRRCPINHPVVMFRKSAVLLAGGYKDFPLFEDYYLWVRMLKNGTNFYNIQESLLFFRFSSDMFKRRGGIKYALSEFRLQKTFYQMGFISYNIFIENVFIRFISRIIPHSLRAILYKKILR